MPVNQGVSLGVAQGKIVIDLSDLNNVRIASQQVGQQVEQNLSRVGKATKGLQVDFKTLAGAFGLTFGVAGIAQLTKFALEADAVATAYKRQTVAAENLAGSQEKLNALLASYEKVTGGVIDKATSLADVTKLQAIGFGDTTAELERFVTAARGISLAMGSSQQYIIGQLQLAIANQSTMRLDQLGLGVSEVEARIKSLRESDKSLSKEMAYQNAILELAEKKFGALAKSHEAQATGAERASKAWKDLRLEIGLSTGDAVGAGMEAITTELEGWRILIQGATSDIKKLKKEWSTPGSATPAEGSGQIDPITKWVLENGGARPGSAFERMLQGKPAFDLGQWLRESGIVNPTSGMGGILQGILPGLAGGSSMGARIAESFQTGSGRAIRFQPGVGGGAGASAGFTEDQQAVIVEHQRAITEIERSAALERQSATEDYERQRSQTIRDYEQSIARDAEDFTRRRQRQEEQFLKSIAEIREEATERETESKQKQEERITEIREDAAKRLTDIEENFTREREKSLRAHQDKIQDLAASGDARGIAEEQRRFKRESEEADTAHEEQIDKINEQLAERLDEEQKAHQERLEEARRADARRIEDMKENFAEQKRLEDEDRAIQLARQKADHEADLAQMAVDHQLTLDQIGRQEAEERAKAEEEFNKALADVGLRNEAWFQEQDRLERSAIESFKRFWDEVSKAIDPNIEEATSGRARPGFVPTPFAEGGPVLSTGLAVVHKGEYVMPAGRGSGGMANLSVGSIIIQEARTPEMTAAAVRKAIIDIAREAAA